MSRVFKPVQIPNKKALDEVAQTAGRGLGGTLKPARSIIKVYSYQSHTTPSNSLIHC